MTKIVIDKLSGHDEEATVGKIIKGKGEEIEIGEVLFTLETSKGSIKYNAKDSGVIISLDIDEGDLVKKNQVVGSIKVAESSSSKTNAPKKVYNFGISTPTKEEIHCQVLVIGGGPGGYVAAIRAAQLGKKVVLVEKDQLGGTCLNYGCIPTKSLAHSVEVLNQMKQAAMYGFKIDEIGIDFKQVMSRKDEVIRRLVSGIQGLMENNQIRVIQGEANVNEDKTIKVKTNKVDATIRYEKMIIATGSSPVRIPIEGADMDEILTSREVLELEKVPSSMTIIGGGIIGMEIAFIYNELGCDVSVVEYLPRVLVNLDTDVSDVVRQNAIEKGIHIYDNAKATSIKKTVNHTMITEIEVDDMTYIISSEKVLLAVGRRANLDGLDLDILGVDLNAAGNGIEINDYMQTSNENIYAIGDITNKIQLAHVASHQGLIAAEHIGGITHTIDYKLVPFAVFTMPEVGCVGMTEECAEAQGVDVKIVKFPYMACGKAVAMNETEGFVKLIVDNTSGILLGGAIVGAHGTDMIATIAQLIYSKTTVDEALKSIYAHPTLGETIHEALLMADSRGIHFG